MATKRYLQPIETRYQGYRFRSRLEARWAVFFDALALRWTYEPEGIVLPSGRWYLPDFNLPDLGWFEIKPCSEPWDGMPWIAGNSLEEEFFAMTNVSGGCLFGTPGPVVLGDPSTSYAGSIIGDTSYVFCECPLCDAIGFQFDGRSARNRHQPGCTAYVPGGKGYNYDSPRLLQAYNAARSARFER